MAEKKAKKLTKKEASKVKGGAAAAKGKAKRAPCVHADGIVADANNKGKSLAAGKKAGASRSCWHMWGCPFC